MTVFNRPFCIAKQPKSTGCLTFWASRILYFGKNPDKPANTLSVIPWLPVIARNRSQGAAWTI